MRRLVLALLFLGPALAVAGPASDLVAEQAPTFPGTKEPVSATGVKSLVDLPASQHMRNSGGNDRTKSNPRGLPGQGHGLCVFTSIEIMSRWLNTPVVSGWQKWMESKPGGGFPAKVDQMLSQFCKEKGVPVPDYVQHTGGDDAFLDLALSTGRGACVTYAGFDGFYRNERGQDVWIDHMVYLAHLDQEWAAIIDNNRPGQWVWMTRKEFLLRWRARGGGWAFVLLASPPPPHLSSDRLFAAAADGCVCGDACTCPPGTCPGGCPVLVGQPCPNGRCPLPRPQAVPVLPAPPATGSGQWLAHTNGREWGFWVAGRCAARAFDDGRVEAVDANGNATGEAIDPPAPLPAGVRQRAAAAPPADQVGENYGVVRDKIHQRQTYSINGVESTEEAARAAVAGALVNDSDRWHLTAVGDPAFLARFAGDVKALPAAVGSKLHVQSYGADNWAVRLFALPSGVSLRKPATARRAEQLGALAVADYSALRLAELLDLMNGPRPKPAPQPATPNAAPNTDPRPAVPPAPPAESHPLLYLGLLALAVYVFLRK